MSDDRLDLLPAGTPIDLDNCAREPIHIPGSIQRRGVMIVVREPEFTVTHVSTNLADYLGVDAGAALGRDLGEVIGQSPASAIDRAAAAFGDLRDRNPLDVTLTVKDRDVVFDAILHRPGGGLLVIELETADGARPFSFPNTYLSVRSTVSDLNRAVDLDELYGITVRAVRALTGFDRVMVYRYDEHYNGEVVAEAKRNDLNPFLGLHYPASDIPAQARALYEKNWIRLISDVDYQPAALISIDGVDGAPLDLTHATLRSVSGIHIEYLHNMGVAASMSISLLRNGHLWGLIACHHYSGPHTPPYGVRAAAEFLGSTLSLRLVDREEDDALRARLEAQSGLAELTAAILDESRSAADAMLTSPGTGALLEFLRADGVAIIAENGLSTRGTVPDDDCVRAISAWVARRPDEVWATDALTFDAPELKVPSTAAGVLALPLPDRQSVLWFRGEVRRTVDWGGDPRNKEIAVEEGEDVRVSPRKSFERWSEDVKGRSEPWTKHERDLATTLRQRLVEALFIRSQRELRTAEVLQRSLLPNLLPAVAGWDLSAHYEPAAGGRVGGDWYDAFGLPDGTFAVALGDVAGHGVATAGVMAQLRNALRAYLLECNGPARALDQLNTFARLLVPGAFATALVICLDPRTGAAEGSSAGHLLPLVMRQAGSVESASLALSPPLGVGVAERRSGTFQLDPGDALTAFSDGLVERRDEIIDTGLARLSNAVERGPQTAREAFDAVADPMGMDDATVLILRRLE